MAEEIEIEVSEDGLQAVIKQITPETTLEDVLASLAAAGVTYGISGEAIQNAISTSQRSNRPIGEIVAAKGTPPKPALPPHIQPPDEEPALPALGPVAKLLELTAAEVVEAAGKLKAKSVLPGENLGTVIVEEGEPGQSVTGGKIELDTGGSAKSMTDPGLGVAKTGIEFTASTYGYAGMLDGQSQWYHHSGSRRTSWLLHSSTWRP